MPPVTIVVEDSDNAKKINDIMSSHSHTFILIRMDGCPPCEATRPNWTEMCKLVQQKYPDNSDIALIDLEKSFLSDVNDLGEVGGFPTIKYINRKKNIIEPYEEGVENSDRSVDSFVKWVDSKLNTKQGGKRSDDNFDDNKSSGLYELAQNIGSNQRHSAKVHAHNSSNVSLKSHKKNKKTRRKSHKKSYKKNKKIHRTKYRKTKR